MRQPTRLMLLAQVCVLWQLSTAVAREPEPRRVQIGVDMRTTFQSCIDSWLPVAEYLSKAIPECRFVIVPLASRQDVVNTLEKGDVEFTALNPALAIMAEDRYGTVPLATMVESDRGRAKSSAADATCGGSVIRRADRLEITQMSDLRGLRFSAVKPWSLTGWFAQWRCLVDVGIDPYKDLKQVVFEGTHEQVVASVLNGSADAGAVDANLLRLMILNNKFPDKALCIMNRQGQAVPLIVGEDTISTDTYPGWVFSKAPPTSDPLTSRVAEALFKRPLETNLDGMPCRIGWVAPYNYAKVRRLLERLLGPSFADSDGVPMPSMRPTWLFPVQVFGVAIGVLFLVVAFVRSRYLRRETSLEARLENTRRELLEVRAEKQRISTILSLAGCGIDIVDDENQIVYADSSLERKFGDWHGRKCHEYFCGSSIPCPGCRRPFPVNEQCERAIDFDCSQSALASDPHAKVHYTEGETSQMIGIPFRDEGGRWLYARVHFPLMAESPSATSPP